jgi:hypothetical protein
MALSVACAADSDPTNPEISMEDGFVVQFRAHMQPSDTGVPFVTPSGSIVEHPRDFLVGKPYLAAIFDGGFAQGVDEPIDHVWGTVPEDLLVDIELGDSLPAGPYDVAFIVYTETTIDDAARESAFAPIPVAGELSAFTASVDEVLEGDPPISNGVLRANIVNADTVVEISNKTNPDDLFDSLVDTILVVP